MRFEQFLQSLHMYYQNVEKKNRIDTITIILK